MSYSIFLLLNVNHDKQELFDHIAAKLEPSGVDYFCLDQSPDVYFSVEYLAEEKDSSLLIEIPFGAEETVMKSVLDFMTHLEERIQVQVFDPQLGKMLKSSEAGQIVDHWKKLNLEALESFSDGHHFLRSVEEREGRREMIEAIRFQEETWQNQCSVGLAYARIGHAVEARKHFERALQLDPQNSGILHALGVTFYNLREYQKAIEYLSASVSADPENAAAKDLIKDCNMKLAAH